MASQEFVTSVTKGIDRCMLGRLQSLRPYPCLSVEVTAMNAIRHPAPFKSGLRVDRNPRSTPMVQRLRHPEETGAGFLGGALAIFLMLMLALVALWGWGDAAEPVPLDGWVNVGSPVTLDGWVLPAASASSPPARDGWLT